MQESRTKKIIRQTKFVHVDKGTGKSFNAFVSQDQIKENAIKCITRSEFWDRFPKLARIASRSGLMDELFADAPMRLSNGEAIIHRLLTELGIEFITQKRFPEVRDKLPLPYDFYIPAFKLLLEYQGEQHYQTTNNRHNSQLVERDRIKALWAPKLGLELITIHELRTIEIEQRILDELRRIDPDIEINRTPLSQEQKKQYKTLGTYTDSDLILVAKNYNNLAEFRATESSVYAIIKRKGLLEQATAHIKRQARNPYTVDELRELVKKYSSLRDFTRHEKGAYLAIRRQGLIQELLGDLKRGCAEVTNWTPEICRQLFEESGRIKSKFRKNNPTAYLKVLEMEWQGFVFQAAVRPKAANSKAIIISGNGLENERFPSLSAASRELNLPLSSLSNYLSGKIANPPKGYLIKWEAPQT